MISINHWKVVQIASCGLPCIVKTIGLMILRLLEMSNEDHFVYIPQAITETAMDVFQLFRCQTI
ncbi:hypothetical protein AW879_10015 [Enterobacter cloacae]|nr:hypothetical protein AW879_10015 [Enterobacter cloacae]